MKTMKFNPLYVLGFLTIALAATHAALPPQLYWKSVLPNTPMPKAVSDLLLQPDLLEVEEDKSTAVSVGKGGVNVDAGKGKPSGTAVNVGKGGVNVNTGKGKPGGGTHVSVGGKGGVRVNTGKPGGRTNVGVGKGGVGVSTGKPGGRTNVGVGKGGVGVSTGKPGGGRTNVGVGKGGVSVHTRHKGKPVYVGVGQGASPFIYNYAATQDQLHDDTNAAIFFLEKDMQPGKLMNLDFTETPHKATFLPRQVADSIPFSSKKLPEIFHEFEVKPESQQGQMMKNTIQECESPGIRGEDKNCATSLESMIDFSTSKLGRNVQAISTQVNKQTQQQEYEIKDGVTKMAGSRSVVCHNQKYAYAVFYCHATQTSKAYMVPLEGADGTKVNAVAVCHTDTSKWNPKHLAFQVLKVKPGTVPICHFLPQDHVVWVPKN